MSENLDFLMCYGEQVGKSHLPNNIPCQDKALCSYQNGVYVAALSDGCGSSDLSHYGSDITVKTVVELFIEKFDEIYNTDFRNDQLSIRKLIIDSIINNEIKFISENESIFEESRNKNSEKYQEYLKNGFKKYLSKKGVGCDSIDSYIEKNKTEFEDYVNNEGKFNYDLQNLNATLIFAATKDGKYILGQVGDGVLGALVDDKLKIVLEENKTGTKNGTFYPSNIYNFAKEDQLWYCHSSFQLKKPSNAGNINAFILTSDGVEAFFKKINDNFHKSYAGVRPLFQQITKAENLEQANLLLKNDWLPRLVDMSPSRDDCSVAILVKPDFVISEYTVKEYPRPTEEEIQKDKVTTQVENKPVENKKEPKNIIQSVLNESYNVFLPLVEYSCIQENIMLEKVLVTYEIVIKTIERDGKYVINTNDPEKITIFEILREFDPLYNWQGNIIEKYE